MKKKAAAPRPTRAKKKALPVRKTTRSRRPPSASAAAAAWDDLRAYQALALSGRDIFSLIDASGKTLYRSPAAGQIRYLPESDVSRESFLDWIWPEDQDRVREKFAEILRNPRTSISFRTRIRTESGDPVWIEGVGTNYLDDPRVGAILVRYLDIGEQMRQQSALEENERRYRDLFEHAAVAIFQSTREGKLLRCNPEFARLFGYDSPEEVIRSVAHASQLFADPARRAEIVERTTSGTPQSIFENLYRRKDGNEFWGLLNIHVVNDAAGRMLYFEGFVVDIDDRRRAEERLRESEEKLRLFIEHAPAALAMFDRDMRYIAASRRWISEFRLPQSDLIGRSHYEIFPELSDALKEVHRRGLSGEILKGENEKFERTDGSVQWLTWEVLPWKKADGSIGGILIFTEDVTARRRAEEALRENEERYHRLFENSLEGIGLAQENRIVDANRAMLDMFGYATLDEFRAVPLLEHVAPESQAEIRRRMEDDWSGGSRFQCRIVRKDGGLRDLEISTGDLTIGGERFTLGTFRDVTEQNRSGEELAALARRHATLLAAIPEIVMEVDTRKVYTWSNPAGVEFFGPDVIGREAKDYFVGEQTTYAAVQPLFNGDEDTVYLESWQRRKDGRKRLLAWWCRNLKNSRGEVIGALSSARDITEQREAVQEIESLSRFPAENPNPVLRLTPEGRLLFANAASRPFLDHWRTKIGEAVPKDCRALVGEAFLSSAVRETQIQIGDRVFACTLTPVPSSGYINVYGRDVTETKRAQDALARQAEELRQRNEELARLNDLTERRLQRLTALRAIDTAITSSFKLELVLNILLGQLADLIGAHAADILIYLPDLQTFRFSCGRGFRATGAQQTYPRKTGSYANQAAQDRRTIKVPALSEAADAARIYPRIAGEGFTSYLCLPLVAKGAIKGVLEVFQRSNLELGPEEENFLEMVAGQAAIAIDNAELFDGLQSTNDELTLAYNDTLSGWARTLELRTRGSGGDAQRQADDAVRLARALGAGEAELVPFYRGAVLHDIGMMGVPESILLKPGPLTDAEWETVRRHPQHAQDLLGSINYLRSAIDIPYCHHEKWDGSGYPRGLAGNQIPFAARVFAVVDVWSSMRSPRPYRPAHTDAEAREEIRRGSGTHFDPAVVKAFLESFAS